MTFAPPAPGDPPVDVAQCVLGRALPGLTHELANSINSVLGYVELMGSTTDPERHKEYEAKLRTYSDRLRRLLSVIRSFNLTHAAPGQNTFAGLGADLAEFLRCISKMNDTRVEVEVNPHLAATPVQVPALRLELLVALDSLVRSSLLKGQTLLFRITAGEEKGGEPPLAEPALRAQFHYAARRLQGYGARLIWQGSGKSGFILAFFLSPSTSA